MTQEQAEILMLIRNNPALTTVDIIERTEIAPANVVGILAFHIEIGHVTWSNVGGGRVYEMTEKGETAYQNWAEIPF